MSESRENLLESLSALMDDEGDDLELRRLLAASEQDPQLLAKWERYHLARAVVKDQGRSVSPQLSARIAETLAEEAIPQPVRDGAEGWRRNLSQLAIAASVAVVCIVAVQSILPGSEMTGSTANLVQQDGLAPAEQAQPASLLAVETEAEAVDTKWLREYIGRISVFEEDEPVRTEHIQDSPLYHLVNQDLSIQP